MQISQCVEDYIRRFRPAAEKETAFYAGQPYLTAAIKVAAHCWTSEGKKHPHQLRIPRAALSATCRALQSHKATLKKCETFDALHTQVAGLIGGLHMIGPLTIYDISLRIGAFLGLPPEKVYLHAGTRVGAAALGLSGDALSRNQLPPEFQPLTAAEIEDCLCIYKAVFAGKAKAPQSCAPDLPTGCGGAVLPPHVKGC